MNRKKILPGRIFLILALFLILLFTGHLTLPSMMEIYGCQEMFFPLRCGSRDRPRTSQTAGTSPELAWGMGDRPFDSVYPERRRSRSRRAQDN